MGYCQACNEETELVFSIDRTKNGKKYIISVHFTNLGKYKDDKVALCIYNENVEPWTVSTHQMTFDESDIISNLLGTISQLRFYKPKPKKEKPLLAEPVPLDVT